MIVMSSLQIYQSQIALEINPNLSCDVAYAVRLYSCLSNRVVLALKTDRNQQTCVGPGSLFAFILPFLVVIPIVLALSLVILMWVTRALFLEFGWAVFHAIGTYAHCYAHPIVWLNIRCQFRF
jgi:hypothetical protein